MPEILVVILVTLLAVIVVAWIVVHQSDRRKRYFYGGAADPLASNRPAPTDSSGDLHTVVEVEESEPGTSVLPGEIPREPQTPDTEPAREDSPGWTDVTDPPPKASEAGSDPDPRRPGHGHSET